MHRLLTPLAEGCLFQVLSGSPIFRRVQGPLTSFAEMFKESLSLRHSSL